MPGYQVKFESVLIGDTRYPIRSLLDGNQYHDPDGAAASWSRILDRPAVDNIIRLDGSQIRFVPIVDGRGPGVSAYDVKVVDRDRVLAAAEKRGRRHGVGPVEVCGCRINLV